MSILAVRLPGEELIFQKYLLCPIFMESNLPNRKGKWDKDQGYDASLQDLFCEGSNKKCWLLYKLFCERVTVGAVGPDIGSFVNPETQSGKTFYSYTKWAAIAQSV